MTPLTPARIRAAWLIALAVDATQIGLAATGPLGFLINVPLDLVTMSLLWWLLGWHWVLLPSCAFEVLPIADMAPTWSLAVWILVRRRKALN